MSEQRLSDEERRDWLRLIKTENVGPATFRSLIARFGSAGQALAGLPDLSHKGGLKRPLAVYSRDAAESDLERAAALGARFVAAGEDGYPRSSVTSMGPRRFCGIMGRSDLASRDSIAIVGARNASAAGASSLESIAAELGVEGFVVVSGLARGIDTAAHEAALERGTALFSRAESILSTRRRTPVYRRRSAGMGFFSPR